MTRVYIGLGSNQDKPARQVTAALEALDTLDDTRLVKVSRLYRTAPWGRTDQSDFVNATAAVDTTLPALTLMAELLALEQRLGRRRDGVRWGPRVIDLDMLLYGHEVIDLPGLIVPHPRMHERGFVLTPLADLDPDLDIPGRGCLKDLRAAISDHEVRVLDDGPLQPEERHE